MKDNKKYGRLLSGRASSRDLVQVARAMGLFVYAVKGADGLQRYKLHYSAPSARGFYSSPAPLVLGRGELRAFLLGYIKGCAR